MSNGFLKVEGEKVIDSKGNSVILRGAGLGGWMNMENFMYLSHRHPPCNKRADHVPIAPDIQAMNINIEQQC